MTEPTFDYLIVGGGAAGCVLAHRLSEDPALSVGLIEAGDELAGSRVAVPVRGVLSKAWRRVDRSVEQPGLNGRAIDLASGATLGGASVAGRMVWTRGHPSDYDHWASSGNEGWSTEEVLPFFQQVEDRRGGSSVRDGAVPVQAPRTDDPWLAVFTEAARQVGWPTHAGNPEDEWPQGLGPQALTQHAGERWSSARVCLQPDRGLSRPAVLTGTTALRVVFDGKRATGVEVTQDGRTSGVLHARCEVIVCAGALRSPHLLQVSGLGDGGVLQKTGIRFKHHLPGVGMNLQDTLAFPLRYAVPGVPWGTAWAHRAVALSRYRRMRRGAFTTNTAEFGGTLRTSSEAERPDVQLDFGVSLFDQGARRFTLWIGALRPSSRGQVLSESPDPFLAPRIDPRYLDDPDDMERLVQAYRHCKRVVQAPALASRCRRTLLAPTDDSGLQVREFIRDHAQSQGHFAGTCRMGTDPLAVVDARLKVHGVQGLRVVDASVMPTLVSGGPLAATVMLAGKAARMILDDARTGG